MGTKEMVILKIRGRAVFDTKEKAKKLFETICNAPCEEFIPERWYATEDEPFKNRPLFLPENLDEPSEHFMQQDIRFEDEDPNINNWGQIILEKKKSPRVLYFLRWDKRDLFARNTYEIDKTFLKNKNNLKKWVEFSHKLFVAHEGWFGYIACESEEEYKSGYIDHTRGGKYVSFATPPLEKGLPGIFWGNYFNSFYVEWFGKDKFGNLPCVEKEILSDGSIFFTTAETPFDWNTEECRKMQKEVIEYLGKDAFFDIEGVKKEIIEKVVEKGIRGMEFYEKIDEIARARFPKKVPKFPFEIKHPLKDKKAENKEVKSEKISQEEFENQMKKEAEIYVNVIKEQKNITLDYTEKSLYKIEEIIDSDIEIGHPENYQGTIQVLGSYLGETLIRNFGGKWVNDPHFNTPAVEINSARFFPHAKVHKRFENGKIDSLTSFYEFVKAKVKPKE